MASRPQILGSPLDEIVACARAIERKADMELRRRGLTMSRYLVLRAAELSKGRSTHSELLKWLPMTQSTLACHVKALTERGLLKSFPGKDKRERLVQLTPNGLGVLKQVFSPAYWNLKFTPTNADDLKSFTGRMENLRDDLDAQMVEAGLPRTKSSVKRKARPKAGTKGETLSLFSDAGRRA